MKQSFNILSVLCVVGLVACGDSDKDGLSNSLEAELGTDPEKVDSDGDGLSDFDEYDSLGTDPTKADSDGDTYLDSWELTEGTDPNDAESRIYKGYWPYQPEKDAGVGPEEASLQVGAPMARVELLDQFGEMVDLYDFSKQGKLTIVDVSAIWCGPCNGMASWLSEQGDSYGWGDQYPTIAEKIHSGKVQWITVLGQDNQGNIPDVNDLARWYEDYPDPYIPVLADTDNSLFANSYLSGGWPTVFLLDGNMLVGMVPGGGNNFYQVLDYVDSLDL